MTLEQLSCMAPDEVAKWLKNNAHKYTLQSKPIFVGSPEDIAIKGEEILCWDGLDWSIDFVEHDSEVGFDYMSNGTQVIAYLPLPQEID